MPDKKINEFDEAGSAAAADLFLLGNPTTGKLSKITTANVSTSIANFADEATTWAGTAVDATVTPAGLAVVHDEKLDIRAKGGVADGTTDNDPAIAAAIAAIPAWGGKIRFPQNRGGGFKYSTGIVIDGKRVSLVGDGPAVTYLDYYGSGTAITLTEPNVTLEGMSIRNQGGTGLKGVVDGKTNSTTLGRTNMRHVWISGGFATAGLHISNRELCEYNDVMVLGNNQTATGILVDDSLSTNPTNKASMQLVFRRVRAIQCTTTNWDANYLLAAEFDRCQAWSGTGTYQFKLGISTWGCLIDGLDVESAGDATKHGVSFAGNNNEITGTVMFSLDRGIDLNNATGCHIGPLRVSTVTSPIYAGGAGNTNNTWYDGGNLGSISQAAPDECLFFGRITRTKNIEVRGLAGAGYLDFVNEQSADPAGATNRARVYTKDNGAGKTQLVVRFATGAVQVIATEP